ncbi:M20 family metallopeptidase [Anaerobacillus isosaccharinicus]|uniref:Peptidase M20 domain-containing protein 2 n=1 Tax=Anaerobacillus isosaccharinicus TaxID=1532552 RepID=A0A1S2LI27_9BACI|nr:M20 family metallopeptidase [Anaerobacillus isosaccharinicus]MBA5586151.1 M20 family metallopeptidase [Anaerobacillus isosaccharinicus]QOY35583.1 M20 family metallopeptidase [Anaerobacillus isosaccharinicus]
MKQTVNEQIEQLRSTFYKISQYIGENPELGHEEWKASKILSEELVNHGFQVNLGTCELPTAFDAVFDSGISGPSVGFMAEYDALPELGHACGHNLIGTMAIAAAIGLSKVIKNSGGKIYVYGTPAEETRGGKVTMAEQGVFDHLDVAMMVHPLYRHEKSGSSLAMDAIQFEFFGKPAHAAASPHEGINALDAVIQTFNGINALRQHITPDARIHGIIPNGGKAANIIPDYAVAQFYVRAQHRNYLNELVEKVKNCAKGAALATGARLETSFYELSYDDLKTNEALSASFTENLIELGIKPEEIHEKGSGGSLDMGNVSHVVPSIHPYIKICDQPYLCHTHEFREAAMSEQGFEGLILAAKCMANTAYDVITNPDLLHKIKLEFEATKR